MKRAIAIISIVSILSTAFPATTRAGILDDIKNGAVCFGANWVATWVVDTIADNIKGRIGGLISDTVPVADSVVRSETQKQTTKERNLDTLARCVARTFLDKEISGILTIAKKGGRDGGPLYVRNWRNFQTSAQYRGEAVFRGILANTKLCTYLEQDTKNLFGVTAKDSVSLKGQNIRVGDLNPFTLRARCTLPANFDLAKYRNDFASNGGWAAFERLLQPENNSFGVALMAADELNKQRETETSAAINEVLANRGYEGLRGNTAQQTCAVRDKNGRCVFTKDIKLPGDYIGGSLEATINAELGWLTNADELNEVIVKLTTRLANRMLNFDQNEVPPQYEGDLSQPSPATSPIPVPGGGGGGDSSCTGGNPLCTCVTEDSNYAKYSDAVFEAEDRAAVARPDLIDSSQSAYTVRPGVSNTDVLNAICAAFSFSGATCRPHARQDDELVLEIASPREDVALDVITGSGALWANPIAACQPGVH